MDKKAYIAIVVLFLAGIGGYFVLQSARPADTDVTEVIGSSRADEDGGDTPGYSLEDVSLHDLESDCWIAIEGNVYDVSPYIASGQHKGGDAILEGCGIDATELFNTRPMGSGTPHSDSAREGIEAYRIGILIR